MNLSARRLARSIHKWLGLVLALQMFGWLSSGLVMSLIPIDMVRGSTWVRQPETNAAGRLHEFRIAPSELPGQDRHASVTAAIRLGEPVYVLRGENRRLRVVHAGSGRLVEPLDATAAAALASQWHADHPDALATELVESPDGEARGLQGPVWRVRLADRWNSHVYLDPQTARLLSVRNDLWRFYDFFWMLHILDFDERSDFNNGLLRGSAALGWFLGLTGLWLLFYSFGRKASERRATDAREG